MAFTTAEIEDGTGKTGAVVYGSDASVITSPITDAATYLVRQAGKTVFAELTGTIGTGVNETPAQEVHCIRGTRYVETYARGRVLGSRTVSDQALLQPRFGQYVDGRLIPHNEIPALWLQACYEAMELSASGEDLFHVVDESQQLKRKKTGAALEKEWFQGSSSTVKIYHSVTRLLDPLIESAFHLRRTA